MEELRKEAMVLGEQGEVDMAYGVNNPILDAVNQAGGFGLNLSRLSMTAPQEERPSPDELLAQYQDILSQYPQTAYPEVQRPEVKFGKFEKFGLPAMAILAAIIGGTSADPKRRARAAPQGHALLGYLETKRKEKVTGAEKAYQQKRTEATKKALFESKEQQAEFDRWMDMIGYGLKQEQLGLKRKEFGFRVNQARRAAKASNMSPKQYIVNLMQRRETRALTEAEKVNLDTLYESEYGWTPADWTRMFDVILGGKPKMQDIFMASLLIDDPVLKQQAMDIMAKGLVSGRTDEEIEDAMRKVNAIVVKATGGKSPEILELEKQIEYYSKHPDELSKLPKWQQDLMDNYMKDLESQSIDWLQMRNYFDATVPTDTTGAVNLIDAFGRQSTTVP